MSQEATKQYLANARPRYQKANRKVKWRILTEFCLISGYHRKHAIRLMNGKSQLRSQRSGPKPKYSLDLIRPLKDLWFKMGQPCSKRMKRAIPGWLPHYRRRHPELSDLQAALLLAMSRSTIDRLLKAVRTKRGISATRAPTGQWYKSVIPIQAKDWNVKSPGHLQGDTVAHCGDRLEGAFANTLTITDIHTSWTENRATWCKGASSIVEALKEIEKGLPFDIESIKFDSGSEFMNYAVISHLRSEGAGIRSKKVEVVRSRPYKKDDNCYVEEKNLTHVRQLIGYDRIDVSECVEILNRIYRDHWNPLQNYFLPAMKLIRKVRVGSRLQKTYDEPKTPYERVLEASKHCSQEKKESSEKRNAELRSKYEVLDPFVLQEGLERELKILFETLRKKRSALKFVA